MQPGMFQGRELATSFQKDRTGAFYNADFVQPARAFGVESAHRESAADLEDVIGTALKASKPCLVEVGRESRPVSTGSWESPPPCPTRSRTSSNRPGANNHGAP